MLIDNRVCA
jgi:large subunit ribosomal protein L27e